MPDLTKLVFDSPYPAFKNNNVATGTLTISGTVSAGTNTKTFTRELAFDPDIVDIMFNGPAFTGGSDNRPSDGWFRQGQIGVPFTGAGDSNWFIFGKVSGETLTVTAVFVWTTASTETLTSTNFEYKVVDYSAQ